MNKEIIKRLIIIRDTIKSVCHAPGCETVTYCPRTCGCKKDRKFKLNTTTAMAWELSNLMCLDSGIYLKDNLWPLVEKVYLIKAISNYHMDSRWRKFFNILFDIICKLERCEKREDYIHMDEVDYYLEKLRVQINIIINRGRWVRFKEFLSKYI
jgi:hypothetical protein